MDSLTPTGVMNRLLAHVGCPVRITVASSLEREIAAIARWIDAQVEDATVKATAPAS